MTVETVGTIIQKLTELSGGNMDMPIRSAYPRYIGGRDSDSLHPHIADFSVVTSWDGFIVVVPDCDGASGVIEGVREPHRNKVTYENHPMTTVYPPPLEELKLINFEQRVKESELS